jgi:hypothetical protein
MKVASSVNIYKMKWVTANDIAGKNRSAQKSLSTYPT